MNDRKREALARAVLSTVANDPDLFGNVLEKIRAEKDHLESRINKKEFDPNISILLDRINDILS